MKNSAKIVILFFVALICGCKEDGIETYNGPQYAYFKKLNTAYSFAFDPGKDSIDVPFQVGLIGMATSYNREILVVIDSLGAGVEASDYRILNVHLRKEMMTDTVYLRVYKSDKLKSQTMYVRMVIRDASELKAGPKVSRYATLTFNDMLIQPAWWDTAMTKDYLGTYSEAKYRTFIIATGINDMTGLGVSEKRAYTIMLKNYIRDHGITEANGSPMVVTLVV